MDFNSLNFLPALIVLGLMLSLWYVGNGPRRKYLAAQTAHQLEQTKYLHEQASFLAQSAERAVKQNELLERIAIAIEQGTAGSVVASN